MTILNNLDLVINLVLFGFVGSAFSQCARLCRLWLQPLPSALFTCRMHVVLLPYVLFSNENVQKSNNDDAEICAVADEQTPSNLRCVLMMLLSLWHH